MITSAFAAMPDEREREARVRAVLPQRRTAAGRRRGRAAARAASVQRSRRRARAASVAEPDDHRDEQQRQEPEPDVRQVLEPPAEEQAEHEPERDTADQHPAIVGPRGARVLSAISAGAAAGPGRRLVRGLRPDVPDGADPHGRWPCRRPVRVLRDQRDRSRLDRAARILDTLDPVRLHERVDHLRVELDAGELAQLAERLLGASAASSGTAAAAVIASNESATWRIRASSGISSPISRSGYPEPLYHSWWWRMIGSSARQPRRPAR